MRRSPVWLCMRCKPQWKPTNIRITWTTLFSSRLQAEFGYPLENDGGEIGRNRSHNRGKHGRCGRGSLPEVEGGRRGYYCQGRISAAIYHLETPGRKPRSETQNRGAARALHHGR